MTKNYSKNIRVICVTKQKGGKNEGKRRMEDGAAGTGKYHHGGSHRTEHHLVYGSLEN